MVIKTQSSAETEQAGELLAKKLRPGDVIAYTGPMGAGKTTFTVGLARGMGLAAWVSSPTFSLVHQYPSAGGGPGLCHFDMYRIDNPEDLYSTGFFDYLDSGDVLAVEWSEHIRDVLPAGTITVDIQPEGESRRRITITGDERF